MAFLLANSFQSSLDKLSGEKQKAAKLAAWWRFLRPLLSNSGPRLLRW